MVLAQPIYYSLQLSWQRDHRHTEALEETMTEDLRKLDRDVAMRIFGWTEKNGYIGCETFHKNVEKFVAEVQGFKRISQTIPPYSSDIAAAWTVVEKMLDRFQVGITFYDGRYECEINDLRDDKYYPEIYGHSKSAPHAICLAALRALKAVEAVG